MSRARYSTTARILYAVGAALILVGIGVAFVMVLALASGGVIT